MSEEPLQTLKRELMFERIKLVESLDQGVITLTTESGKTFRFAGAAHHDGTVRVRVNIRSTQAVEL